MPSLRPAHGRAALAAVAAAGILSACGGHASPATSSSPPTSAGASSPATGQAAATAPAMVAVTSGGALVTLNPATGAVQQTLVSSGVAGGEVSVAANGLVYFAAQTGCTSKIEEIPVSGGTAAVITSGSLPAVSPDGAKLAYTTQPSLTPGCVPNTSDLVPLFNLDIRTLSSGTTRTLPMVPASEDNGLPAPISFLSWAADNVHLAVSIASAEDNEGWALNLVNTTQAQYYRDGAGVTYVPATGANAQQSYLRQGVYMPSGDLFVSRVCCAGIPPPQNIPASALLLEVSGSGSLVHQVAVGFTNLDHTSLDVSTDGNWLLYLAGTTLYVSKSGATPAQLTTGVIAAAWG